MPHQSPKKQIQTIHALCQAMIKPARELKEKGKVFKSRGSFFVQLFPLGKGEILYLIILLKLGQWFYREEGFFKTYNVFSLFHHYFPLLHLNKCESHALERCFEPWFIEICPLALGKKIF